MKLTTDDVVRMTRDGTDDKAWRKELREKRKKRPDPPQPVGECCAYCRWWSPPYGRTPYGACGLLLVVTKREPNGPEKGEVVTQKRVARFTVGLAEPLPTTAGYAACMAYESGIDRSEDP